MTEYEFLIKEITLLRRRISSLEDIVNRLIKDKLCASNIIN